MSFSNLFKFKHEQWYLEFDEHTKSIIDKYPLNRYYYFEMSGKFYKVIILYYFTIELPNTTNVYPDRAYLENNTMLMTHLNVIDELPIGFLKGIQEIPDMYKSSVTRGMLSYDIRTPFMFSAPVKNLIPYKDEYDN